MNLAKPAMLLAVGITVSFGCDEKQPEKQDAKPVEPAAAKQDAPKQQAVEKPTAPEPGAKNWHVKITGVDVPVEEGKMVMTMNAPGGVATYKFGGPNMQGSMKLKDVKVGETGEWAPYQLSMMYMNEKWNCGMSSMNKDEKLTVKVSKKGAGVRGDFSGDVTCAKIGGGNERKKAKVEGWFEK